MRIMRGIVEVDVGEMKCDKFNYTCNDKYNDKCNLKN